MLSTALMFIAVLAGCACRRFIFAPQLEDLSSTQQRFVLLLLLQLLWLLLFLFWEDVLRGGISERQRYGGHRSRARVPGRGSITTGH
jgi:hypothetical protein